MKSGQHIVLAGCGHAALPLVKSAKYWKKFGAKVTVVNDGRYLYYSGMIPQFLGGFYSIDEVRIDVHALCNRYGAGFINKRISKLDPSGKRVITESGEKIMYDFLVVNTGAQTPVSEVTGNHIIIPVKPFGELIRIPDILQQTNPSGILISGAGAAGTEIALNLSHTFGHAITLAEADGRILPGFSSTASKWAAKRLEKRGVKILTGTQIDTKSLGGKFELIILAIGNRPVTGITEMQKAEKRIITRKSLQSIDFPEIFAAGDCAFVGEKGYAQIGVHAVKQGKVLRENLGRLIRNPGARLTGYRPYPVNPLIISDGNSSALVVTKHAAIGGKWALKLKHRLDSRFVNRYRF